MAEGPPVRTTSNVYIVTVNTSFHSKPNYRKLLKTDLAVASKASIPS